MRPLDHSYRAPAINRFASRKRVTAVPAAIPDFRTDGPKRFEISPNRERSFFTTFFFNA